MYEGHGIGRAYPARWLLLALFAGLVWCALSIFGTGGSASAHEDPADHDPGILGTVGTVVNGLGETVGGATQAVDQVVTAVTTSVAPAAQPVVAPLPAPVAHPVADAIDTVRSDVAQATAGVDHAVTAVVDTAASTVSEIAQYAPATAVVQPVVDTATRLPVVGSGIDSLGVGALLLGAAGAVDDTVEAVVGTAPTVDGILPPPPLSGLDPILAIVRGSGTSVLPLPSEGPNPSIALPSAGASGVAPAHDTAASRGLAGVTSADLTGARGTGASASASPAVASDADAAREGGALPGPTAPTGSISAAAAGAAAQALAFEHASGPYASLSTFRSHTDDALPGAPVHDTDVAPD
jgi:hypothetical protein